MKHSKHQNQVRIIGGSHRGRKLHFNDADGLRPTPDSVRERVFNWFGQDLTGKTVLDLFSGSGALGLEAASRNARRVVLVENNRRTLETLKQNNRLLDFRQTEVVFSDGLSYLKNNPLCFDVIFLDPPFAWNRWPELFELLKGRLKTEAVIYLEAGALPDIPEWLNVFREGKSGLSRFKLLVHAAE
ncbi:16S rRNA (guanine(966)-N(2))-methyltransferase RsmD [Neisseria animaloris]|uniref:DNA methylase n=1 Tax=Neisseria animaloris TaxID=326522 RepID=A0A3S4YIS6_9NEIS|nr:16S rRNA (guanine(966)-N(2))-methyltransferase RsmD [Neisseria animaloris]VEJ22113.1 DNA methylase [Neisseria animaloris]